MTKLLKAEENVSCSLRGVNTPQFLHYFFFIPVASAIPACYQHVHATTAGPKRMPINAN